MRNSLSILFKSRQDGYGCVAPSLTLAYLHAQFHLRILTLRADNRFTGNRARGALIKTSNVYAGQRHRSAAKYMAELWSFVDATLS